MKFERMTRVSAGLSVAALVLAGCSAGGDPDGGQTESTLTMAVVTPDVGQAFNFAPGFSDWDSLLVRPVYEFMLTRDLDADGGMQFQPGLAEQWEFSDDLATLTLDLREGGSFSDGEPVDAEAVVANVDYWLDSETPINWGRFAAGATAVDENTVEVALSDEAQPQGIPQILFYLANSMVMSPKALEDPDTLATNPVGSGPYVMDTSVSTPGSEYTFSRVEDHWNSEAYAYDKVVMRLYPDTIAAVNALRSGQVDFAPVDADSAEQVSSGGFKLLETAGIVRGLMLGDKAGSISAPLADVRVRRAMNMAFDREAIAQNVEKGYATATVQPWTPAFPQYSEDLEDLYPYDLDAAKTLLAEAGYPNGFDLTLPTYTDQPALTKYDPIVKQSLEDIGIRVTYETTDWYTAVTEPKFAVTNNYIGSFVAQPYYLAYKGLFNPWEFKDDELQGMIDTYNFGTPEESSAIAPEIGRDSMEKAWMLILTAPSTLYAMTEDVEVTTNLPAMSAPDFQFLRPRTP